MPRTLRSATSERTGQTSTPLEVPQTRTRTYTRNVDPNQATRDPHYVPNGSERMTDQFFAKYGWRERSLTLAAFSDSSRAFWLRQGPIPEEWDMVEMAEKRNLLNSKLGRSEKISYHEWGNMALFFTRAVDDDYSPSECVNRLEVNMQEKRSKQYAKYVSPGAPQHEDNEVNGIDRDDASEASDADQEAEASEADDAGGDSEGSEAGFTAEDNEPGDGGFTAGVNEGSAAGFTAGDSESSDPGSTAEELDARDVGDTAEGIDATDASDTAEEIDAREERGRSLDDEGGRSLKRALTDLPPTKPHRWMNDERVLKMSEQDRLAFSEQRFKELPKFSAEMDIENIPPPHPFFRKEWEECLEDAAGIWNSMGIQDDNPPSFSCYAALMRDPDFLFMCTLRAFEYSWMCGYRGPCVVQEMLDFWSTVTDHVTLPMGIRIDLENANNGYAVWLCFVLPPTVPCQACTKTHKLFRFEYVLQIGLQRLTQEKADAMARAWERRLNKEKNKASVSHLQEDATCKHPLHYVIEPWKINLERVLCSNNGKCGGHTDADGTDAIHCQFPQCIQPLRDNHNSLVPHLLEYLKIIREPHPCPHEGCDSLLCWPELFSHYVSNHLSGDVLPRFEHSGFYLPCLGCPFAMALSSTTKGSGYMFRRSNFSKSLMQRYRMTECQRWVHHIAAYLFFAGDDGGACASWWESYFVEGETAPLLTEARKDSEVGIIGMQPKDVFMPIWQLPADWYQANGSVMHLAHKSLDAMSSGWSLECHNRWIKWLAKYEEMPTTADELRDAMRVLTERSLRWLPAPNDKQDDGMSEQVD